MFSLKNIVENYLKKPRDVFSLKSIRETYLLRDKEFHNDEVGIILRKLVLECLLREKGTRML